MASNHAIATGLGLMHECFPTREITPATAKAFALLFEDASDEDFLKACKSLCRESGRTFFPTPGEITAVLTPPAQSLDVDHLLSDIHDLGEYGPTGWRYPRIEAISQALGESVAEAYKAAGGTRCFADADRNGQSITRDIARREFAAELARSTKTNRLAIGAGNGRRLLDA